MTTVTNREYYARRVAEESQLALTESDHSVRQIHETLTKMYKIRLAAEERACQVVPEPQPILALVQQASC